MNKPHRQHPAAMLRYAGRYLFLLLVPLARGLSHIRSPHGLYAWIRGSWVDLLTAGSILLLTGLAWWRHTYCLDAHALTVQRGILLRRTTAIPLRYVATLTVERRLLYAPFGVLRVTADTDAGHRRRVEVTLLIGRKQAGLFIPDSPAESPLHPRPERLLLLSLLFSNSLSGIVLVAVGIYQSGRLFGESVQQLLLANLQAAADRVEAIPRAAALLGLLLLVGWFITALGHLLRHLPFTVYRREETLVITTGRLVRRTHICAIDNLHYADCRQTVAGWLLHRTTVYISCTGYGKDKNTLAVLLPPAPLPTVGGELRELLPHLSAVPLTVSPVAGALRRYGRLPLFAGLAIGLLNILLADRLPPWAAQAAPSIWLGLLPCLWLLAVRLLAFKRAGIGCHNGVLTVSTCRRLTLHRVTVPLTHITAVSVRQSPWGRRAGRCDVRIFIANEHRHPYRVRHLPTAQVEALHQLFRKEE